MTDTADQRETYVSNVPLVQLMAYLGDVIGVLPKGVVVEQGCEPESDIKIRAFIVGPVCPVPGKVGHNIASVFDLLRIFGSC